MFPLPTRRVLPVLAIACPLIFAGCGKPHAATGRSLTGPAFEPVAAYGTERHDVHIVSLNLRRPFLLDGLNHWHNRRDRVADYLQSQQPDLIGTQECLADQADALLDAMPGYAMIGAGRDNGDRRGEMCALFYRYDRFELVRHGHFWLSDTPTRPGSKSWGALWTRMVTWAHLHDRDTERDLHIFNTHFSVTSAHAREQSARLLRRTINELAPDGPVIVTGDFNEDADRNAYRHLTREPTRHARLHDTYRTAPHPTPEIGTRHGFRGGTGGPRIDWVLASEHFDTRTAHVMTHPVRGRMISDHHPVHAVVRFHQTPALARTPDTTPTRRGPDSGSPLN